MGNSTFDKWDLEEETTPAEEHEEKSPSVQMPNLENDLHASLDAEISRTKSNAPGETDTERQLVMVRRSYNEKIPYQLNDMEKALDTARQSPEDLESVKQAHSMANSLRGTAGTLGFIEVSQAVGKIEETLKSMLAGDPGDEGSWDALVGSLQQAKQAPERPSLLDIAPLHFVGIATFLIADEKLSEIAAIDTLARRNLIQVIPVTNFEEATVKLRQRHFDGAIVDTTFGGKEGATRLAQYIRSTFREGRLPIAFMSDDSSMQSRVAASHAGAAQFVKKPLSGEDLVEMARYFNSIRDSVKAKVLLVDDDESFRAHVETILGYEGMEVTSIGNPEDTIDVVEKANPDLVLVDVKMPGVSGYDVCRMIRSTATWKDLPIIFLTSETGQEVRLECFRAGGDDYIEKPVLREELIARIEVRLERSRLSKERADRDGLTGLPNRRAFLDMMRLRIEEGRRYKRPVSLCLIDLDKFKNINDTYGHMAGDRVLAALGKLLSSRFRAVDVRGRWGGEEFAVAFYGEDAHTSQIILLRALEEFRQMPFEGDRGELFNATFSGGIATFPRDGTTFEDLFRVADDRLYAAKETGRNRVAI